MFVLSIYMKIQHSQKTCVETVDISGDRLYFITTRICQAVDMSAWYVPISLPQKTERTRTMKKAISLILCFAMLCAVLAGCAQTGDTTPVASEAEDSSEPTASDQVTIVWQSWDAFSKYEASVSSARESDPFLNVAMHRCHVALRELSSERNRASSSTREIWV